MKLFDIKKLWVIIFTIIKITLLFLWVTFILYPRLTAANTISNIFGGVGVFITIVLIAKWSMDCTEYVLNKKNQSETKTENENK